MTYDFEHVYNGLKDFQLATVDQVFRRMYRDRPPAQRYLVADEVGLGKTLVARGLIARAIEHLSTREERIDVIYICSNADIAKDNIRRLNVFPDRTFQPATRLTLLPRDLPELDKHGVNFISFTPGTAFDLGA